MKLCEDCQQEYKVFSGKSKYCPECRARREKVLSFFRNVKKAIASYKHVIGKYYIVDVVAKENYTHVEIRCKESLSRCMTVVMSCFNELEAGIAVRGIFRTVATLSKNNKLINYFHRMK